MGFFSVLLNAMLSDVTSLHGEESPAGFIASIMKKNFSKDFFALDTSPPTKSGGVMAHAVACKGLDIIVSPKMEINGSTATFQDAFYFGKDEEKTDEVDVEFDTVILCTGYKLDFEWIGIEGENTIIEPNPRKWFKHCFPAGLGDHVAFLGYSRPNQGGIPQCSELLARYVTLLLKGERELPSNYAELALREGEEEKATFYATPDHHALVEFPPYAASIARLIGCEPRVPLSPSRYAKFWTLPAWMCFYRLNGPGANPKACWDVVDKYSILDTFVPFPLVIIFFLFGILMQPLFFFEFILQKVFKEPSKEGTLPKGYKMRVGGHFYQLNGNDLRLQDLVHPTSGWLLVEVLAVFMFHLAITHLLWSALLLLGFGGYVKRDKIKPLVKGYVDLGTEKLKLLNKSSPSNNEYGSTEQNMV